MNKYWFVFVIVAAIAFGIPAFGQTHPPTGAAPPMTAEKWREDLRFMAAGIEKLHQNAFHSVSREEFYREVNTLEQKIGSLEDHQVVVELMRIVALVGDGHTGLRWGGPLAAAGVLPVRFYYFEDGIFIQNALPEHKDLLGAKVVAVNGIPVDKAVDKLRPYIWRDNEMGVRSNAPIYLSVPPILHTVGLSNSKNSARFTLLKEGTERTVDLKPTAKLNELWDPPASWLSARAGDAPVPHWQKQPENKYWSEILPESRTLYIQYNEVQNKPEESIEAFFNRVIESAENQPVERLVIDLRRNGGGNNYLNLPITIAVIRSKFNVRGKLFVITGRETFSAAQNAVNDLEKYTNAIFVGEPTGASPNHFGDARPIILPNSQVRLQASTLWWQDKDPRDVRVWKAPHIAADLTFEDYKKGRDPAMEAILRYKPKPTLRDIVNEARAKGDVAGFISKYKEFKADPEHKYEDTLTVLNQVGHFLLGQKMNNEALSIFKINAAENPNSAIVHQSLGDVYAIIGDKTAAIANYKKALTIDPKIGPAAAALKELEKK
ncbi:MAG: hypothetical protein AB7Q37_02385 [Pyrinomonadaceae bacterium]